MRSATCDTSSSLGFSDDTSEFMNSNGLGPRGRDMGRTRTPSLPTTMASPTRTWCIGSVRTWPSGRTTSPQSISGLATGTHRPWRRTSVARLVVE